MSGEAGSRPGSGLWSLWAWLRREEAGSCDSLSSAGSARTAASFAFTRPAPATPRDFPPPAPSDSCRRRARDADARRLLERDVSLRRKYGLLGYDAGSLPTPPRAERARRAASEALPRPPAHVPGKRRAPPPPRPTSLTLTRRRAKKRPAPLPPFNVPQSSKENIQIPNIASKEMNAKAVSAGGDAAPNDGTAGCKSEKYSKRDTAAKEVKRRSEKSLLKQFFDNRRRHSAMDPAPNKFLPSISELDRQAADIINTCKLKEMEPSKQNASGGSAGGDKWFCTLCLRKYDATVVTCQYCLDEQKRISIEKDRSNPRIRSVASNIYTEIPENPTNVASTNKNNPEDVQKLKEMLKEMKDSLSKKSNGSSKKVHNDHVSATETPTLRIGSKPADYASPSTSSSQIIKSVAQVNAMQMNAAPVLVRHNVISVDSQAINNSTEEKIRKQIITPTELPPSSKTKIVLTTKLVTNTTNQEHPGPNVKKEKDVHIPLKISSLLNPVYIPKNPVAENKLHLDIIADTKPQVKHNSKPSQILKPNTEATEIKQNIDVKNVETKEPTNVPLVKIKDPPDILISTKPSTSTSSNNQLINYDNMSKLDQHFRRRHLINQLEQSIAKGDEQAAAEAASKLAQLRLSCSVLSFTSELAATPSTSSNTKGNMPTSNNRSADNITITKILQANLGPKMNKSVPQTSNKPKEVKKENEITKEFVKQSTNLATTSKMNENINITAGPSSQPSTSKLLTNDNKKITTKRENTSQTTETDMISIPVWVEDRVAARGEARIRVRRGAALGELRAAAARALGIAPRLQRWVVGNALCGDDTAPLTALAGPALTAPFYLCLVDSDQSKEASEKEEPKVDVAKKPDNIEDKEERVEKEKGQTGGGDVYAELIQLEAQALVPNREPFECEICLTAVEAGAGGVVLRECLHSFCRECLAELVRLCAEPYVACPATDCAGFLQEREIRGLVPPSEYERWLWRGLAAAESAARGAVHCRTRDCRGWADCEPGVRAFVCPVCARRNCLCCQAIHEGETCEQYRARLDEAAKITNDTNDMDASTKALLDSLIARGEALECPECKAILTKKWGCDWVKCGACKMEICWVTRGRRWGPAGRGDTSAGCRCGVDGKRCHPKCSYCH